MKTRNNYDKERQRNFFIYRKILTFTLRKSNIFECLGVFQTSSFTFLKDGGSGVL